MATVFLKAADLDLGQKPRKPRTPRQPTLAAAAKQAARAGLAITGVTLGPDGSVTAITFDRSIDAGNGAAFDATPDDLRKLI